MNRRTYLSAVGTALTLPTGRAAASDEPDFTIESSEKTHKVYWRPESNFGENVIARADIGGDAIRLNESRSDGIDSSLLSHEVGHNLGERHEDGTLMAPTPYRSDQLEDEPLSETTRDIFEKLDGVTVIDWTADDARETFESLTEEYVSGNEMKRAAYLFAVERYVNEWDGCDAYYHHDWPDIESGHFYRIS